MCGRLTQRYAWRDVVAFSRLTLPAPALNLRPRYNLAPSQAAAVVREDDGKRRLAMLRWGLIPSWADDPRIGHRLINARVLFRRLCEDRSPGLFRAMGTWISHGVP